MNDKNKKDEILNDFEYTNEEKMKDNTKEVKIITINVKNLIEHPENKKILPSLDKMQLQLLLENIQKNGFTEPIHITKRAIKEGDTFKQYVLDGNNRIFEIINKHPELNINTVPAIEIDINQDEEKDYIFERNSGRRQITKLSMTYIIGNLYNTRKLKQGEKKQIGQNVTTGKSTPEELSSKFNLSDRTIKRHGTFARHCNTISENTNSSFLFFLLNDVKTSQKEITDLSKMSIDKIKQVFNIYENSKNVEPETLKVVLKQVGKKTNKKIEKKKLVLEVDQDKYSKIEKKAKELNISVDELLNKLLEEL